MQPGPAASAGNQHGPDYESGTIHEGDLAVHKDNNMHNLQQHADDVRTPGRTPCVDSNSKPASETASHTPEDKSGGAHRTAPLTDPSTTPADALAPAPAGAQITPQMQRELRGQQKSTKKRGRKPKTAEEKELAKEAKAKSKSKAGKATRTPKAKAKAKGKAGSKQQVSESKDPAGDPIAAVPTNKRKSKATNGCSPTEDKKPRGKAKAKAAAAKALTAPPLSDESHVHGAVPVDEEKPAGGAGQKAFGCPRCRHAMKGCISCKNPSYKPRASRAVDVD